MIRLYTAAASAVAIVENGGVKLTLEERGAQCLAVDPNDPDTVYIGTSDEGLFRSSDGGRSWDRLAGVAHPRVTAIAISLVDGALYAGTEPSSLFVSRDSGGSWRELEGLKSLPSASTWSFPPRPWTSHVRSLALSPEDPNLIVAGIELGGVVRSTDGGESWQDQRPGAYADCHALATHVSAPATLYEAAGGGFAESKDFGESWTATDVGIAHRYVWGLAVDRDDPALLYVSAAEGPGRAHSSGFSDAAIYRRNASSRWEPVTERLAGFPYALAADPDTTGALYAGFGDGSILHSSDAGSSWDEVAQAPGLDALAAVAV
jgi:photosystem II stability/assembly factor-like uncharacterized protein